MKHCRMNEKLAFELYGQHIRRHEGGRRTDEANLSALDKVLAKVVSLTSVPAMLCRKSLVDHKNRSVVVDALVSRSERSSCDVRY